MRALCILSGLYDLLLGLGMLLAPTVVARAFGAPEPVPVVNAQLNGLFALCLASGYFWTAGDPRSRRGFLWAAGVQAKTMGAALFLWDHYAHGSPTAYLLFAVTDGALALWTLVALLRTRDAARVSP
jgi:hypothetical protein